MRKLIWILLGVLALAPLAVTAQDDNERLTFGLVLVGPRDDGGWSQAHYEAGLFMEDRMDATMLLYQEYATRNQLLESVVDQFVDQGARLVFLTSEDMGQEAIVVAEQHPEVAFVHISGDAVLTATAPPNLGNLMGQMEWGKFAAGCAAALTTETGQIGYLGPLINPETRRLAASAYLGARHCYREYRDDLEATLSFRVEWVGFWFYINSAVTNNPRVLTFSMYNSGIDVVISGIDTPTALEVAAEFQEDGENVYATAYDSIVPCDNAPDACLGAAFFNWRGLYAQALEQVIDGAWSASWDWTPPNWDHFDNPAQTPVGFVTGGAFPPSRADDLNDFIDTMAEYTANPFVPVSFPLWQGPLRLQDGTLLAAEAELVNVLDVWYLPQLLDGMDGESFQFELGLEEREA